MRFPLHFALVAVLVAIFADAGRAQPAAPPEPNPAEQQAAPGAAPPPAIEPATGAVIEWKVANRFRLFRDERDFRRHVEAARGRSVFETEQALAEASEGRGWARDMVARLCLDGIGRLADQCVRDGVREDYLDPADHRVEVRLSGLVPAGAACSWTFAAEGDAAPHKASADCTEPVAFRARHGKPTVATADIAGEIVRRATAEIAVRDLLIAGLGDSVASGDGNPDRPVALADDGFCFRRFLGQGRTEYFRPGRVGFSGDRACDDDSAAAAADRAQWAQLSARWMSAACHRSLYGYQLRTALAIAIETPHAAVTFLPLACTGATIDNGLFNGQRARELACGAGTSCPRTTPGQLALLGDILSRARRRQRDRTLDLVFLTIGANDINFSGLIADIIIEARGERAVATRAGLIATVEAAQAVLDHKLAGDFTRLRAALKPLVGNNLERVVFVSYGHPALSPAGGPCPGGRGGFDVHPAFEVGAERLKRTATFVQDKFLPALKGIATCQAKGACADPADAMTFVDQHQAAFAEHGFCSRAETDPVFDRECFAADGTSFEESPVDGAAAPLACGLPASEFRAYARRARWIRTANDSYFAAMTYPEGVSAGLEPSDLHDAMWGVLAAVYGGAIHPTAEGHAAMADAALPAAKGALHLPMASAPVTAAPLPPLPR
jgi:lysophospholipase L1-like esterase